MPRARGGAAHIRIAARVHTATATARAPAAATAPRRLILGGEVPVQSPPNLSADPATLRRLLACGVDDWGGVSPGVTIDHVNPEAR